MATQGRKKYCRGHKGNLTENTGGGRLPKRLFLSLGAAAGGLPPHSRRARPRPNQPPYPCHPSQRQRPRFRRRNGARRSPNRRSRLRLRPCVSGWLPLSPLAQAGIAGAGRTQASHNVYGSAPAAAASKALPRSSQRIKKTKRRVRLNTSKPHGSSHADGERGRHHACLLHAARLQLMRSGPVPAESGLHRGGSGRPRAGGAQRRADQAGA
jgi:hypothetical protein